MANDRSGSSTPTRSPTASASGDVSAKEVLETFAERIERYNEELNAIVHLDLDGARAQAAKIDSRVAAGEDPGPLAGVPIGIKDLEDVAGHADDVRIRPVQGQHRVRATASRRPACAAPVPSSSARRRRRSSAPRRRHARCCSARRATRGTSNARRAARPAVRRRPSPRPCSRSRAVPTAAARSASPRRTPASSARRGRTDGSRRAASKRPTRRRSDAWRAPCATRRATGTASSARTSATRTRSPIPGSRTKRSSTRRRDGLRATWSDDLGYHHATKEVLGITSAAAAKRRRCRRRDTGRSSDRAAGHVGRLGPAQHARAPSSPSARSGPTAKRTSHR